MSRIFSIPERFGRIELNIFRLHFSFFLFSYCSLKSSLDPPPPIGGAAILNSKEIWILSFTGNLNHIYSVEHPLFYPFQMFLFLPGPQCNALSQYTYWLLTHVYCICLYVLVPVLVIEIPSTPCKFFHYIMKRFYGYVAHHVCSFCAAKQTHQIKWCCNLIAASQKYLSPDTSLSHCEMSKVILRHPGEIRDEGAP